MADKVIGHWRRRVMLVAEPASAIEKVAAKLGNTLTIWRKCYVHPEVLNSYLDGNLVLELKSQAENELRGAVQSLKPEEAAILALLRSRLAKDAERPASTKKRAARPAPVRSPGDQPCLPARTGAF
jgi:DNA topoisomerase IB